MVVDGSANCQPALGSWHGRVPAAVSRKQTGREEVSTLNVPERIPERQHLLVSEVCTLFRCNESTLRRWRRLGRGPKYFKTPTGTVLYPRSEIERYMAELPRETP
jgi:hypothetical protein